MLTGTIELEMDGERVTAHVGDIVSIPPDTPHTFWFVDEDTTFVLVSHTDVSTAFFRDIANEVSMPPDLGLVVEITERHGVTLIGPPPER